MSIVFDYLGKPMTYQKIIPGDVVTGIHINIYKYGEWLLPYTSGGTVVMKVGDTIVGATSAATGVIVDRTITAGTDGGGDAVGVLTIKCLVGTFASENLRVEGTADVATIAANAVPFAQSSSPFLGKYCKACLVSGVANDMNVTMDGTLPSAAAGQDVGVVIGDRQSYVMRDIEEIINFRCIDRVSLSAGKMKVICYF